MKCATLKIPANVFLDLVRQSPGTAMQVMTVLAERWSTTPPFCNSTSVPSGGCKTDRETLRGVVAAFKGDEAHYCAGLVRLIKKHGGTPSARTGDFVGKVMALSQIKAQLDLLNRGQSWVARRIEERLSESDDAETRAFLREMAQRHRRNVETSDRMLHHLYGRTSST